MNKCYNGAIIFSTKTNLRFHAHVITYFMHFTLTLMLHNILLFKSWQDAWLYFKITLIKWGCHLALNSDNFRGMQIASELRCVLSVSQVTYVASWSQQRHTEAAMKLTMEDFPFYHQIRLPSYIYLLTYPILLEVNILGQIIMWKSRQKWILIRPFWNWGIFEHGEIFFLGLYLFIYFLSIS